MSDNINKVVVIYKSKYGSAQRYAQWIADEVKADLFERSKITLNDILKYDTIVLWRFTVCCWYFGYLAHKKRTLTN